MFRPALIAIFQNLKIILLCMVVSVLPLAGCQTQSASPNNRAPQLGWAKRTQILERLTTWHLWGRVSIQHNNRTDVFAINWQRSPGTYQMILTGPLGFGQVAISGVGNKVVLSKAGKPVKVSSTARDLMQKQLGWFVPLAYLQHWIKSIPGPGQATFQWDAYHRLIGLSQRGFQIRYMQYLNVQGIALPQAMYILGKNLRIKLVIKRWQI